ILIGFAVQELVGGELKAPAQVYAPASPQRMRIGGREIDLVGGEFGQRIAWLTTSRLVTGTAVLIIALGGILRLWRYTFWGMWLDEGFALLYSQQSWRSVVGLNGFYSPHPPLYFTLTKVFNEVMPDATAGRTVSVLCGILVLPVFYLLARRILDPVASLVATLVFALSPIHLYYSQEARMYALVVFSVTLAYLALVAFIQTHSKWWAALYALALVIAVYGDYSSLFALAPQAFILLWYIGRDWRKMIPILVAAGLAILAYAPWLPQVFHSVNSANEDERRQDYLGAGFGRVMTLSLRITGFSSDQFGPYFPSLNPTAWDSFAELRSLMVLGMAPVVVLGFIGLWRRWTAMAITFSFLGSIAVTALVSFISPSFAERSILCAAVGWSLLLGAAFNGRLRRDRTPFAALSLIFVLLICLTTVSNIYTYGLKSRWDDAAADLAYAEPLQFPVITYSYGEVANTLVEAYEPGLLNRERLITVRDGVLEKTLSNDILPHTGITVADVDAGELKTLLPETAENDYVWFLYYQRIGQENVELGIQDAGYVRIIEKTYVSPRNQVFLDLYARPDAATSVPITSLQPFTSGDAWGIPANAPLVKASEDGTAVSIQNQSKLGTAIATQVSISGPALVVFNADVETLGSGKAAQVILRCLSGTGVVLNESTAVTPGRRNLLHHRSAIVCPEDTQQIRITLLNLLTSEQALAQPWWAMYT
ncbi:MAG TPA: glycosyltransferase family 39 protein, partial [Thermomicrobiales bacterium]|nr:glycosyltransferase family 39 protein [Thermomicrobiales bacterium]